MKNTPSNAPDPESTPSSIAPSIIQERIRQARYSFNLALIATALGVLVSLVGVVILLTGKNYLAGVPTTSGGAIFTIGCTRLAKDANDRLDKLAKMVAKPDDLP
jgi:hypothetical protein